jgi:hypothetical protein
VCRLHLEGSENGSSGTVRYLALLLGGWEGETELEDCGFEGACMASNCQFGVMDLHCMKQKGVMSHNVEHDDNCLLV